MTRVPRDLIAVLALAAVVAMTVPSTSDGRPSDPEAPFAASRLPLVDREAGFPPTVAAVPMTEGERPVDVAVSATSVDPGSASEPILPRTLTGAEALARPRLLPDLAQRNNIDPEQLGRLLAGDESVFVEPSGRAYFVDSGHDEHSGPEAALAEPDASASTDGSLGSAPAASRRYPTSETFRLHSRPGASRTIFIDTDGADVVDTAWNSSRRSQPLRNASWLGWDSDGAPTSFTSSEHAWIQEVWRQVSEAYAAFDVDVTTQDPGRAGLLRASSADTTYGSHVVLTTSAEPRSVLCGGCIGVAYVGTFGDVGSDYYQPAWVFASSATSPTIAAQTVSHEVGHNLNLGHDGTTTADYYAGSRSWGPIMGSASNRAVSHWSRGEYADASNSQDDLAVMQAQGLPLRADDHGDQTARATELGSRESFDVEGVISTAADVDVFRIDPACTHGLRAAVSGVGAQATLDLQLDLLDADGRLLVSDSPASGESGRVSTGMDAALERLVSSDTYYLRVDGVGSGSGSIASGSGWSDYASLGQYRLTANGCSEPAPGPSASPTPTPSPTTGPTPSPTPPTSEPTPSSPGPSSTPTSRPDPVRMTAPGAPLISSASSGRRGRPVTATVRWQAPRSSGGATVTGYRVTAYKLAGRNRVARTYRTGRIDSTLRAVQVSLPRGRYAFSVQATNAVGSSPWSSRSNAVRAR